MKIFFCLSAIALVSTSAHAASSLWTNTSTDGNWDTVGNWDNGVPSSSDQAVINNGDTITKSGDVTFTDVTSSTIDGLQLTNGTLNISGNFTTTNSGGADSSITNNLGVSTGSTTGTLGIGGTLTIGNTNTTSSSISSFNIYSGSSLSANAFQGRHGFFGNAGPGGWALNVSGGSLDISTTFDFSSLDDADSSNPAGRLTLGTTGTASGGTVTIGTMSTDWARNDQYVLFNDSLASLTFGKTNYTDLTAVQALITGDFIRKDAGISDGFNIADNGTSWTVTIVPEPSALLLSSFGALFLLRRKR